MAQTGFRQMLVDLIRGEMPVFVSLGVVTEIDIADGGRMLCVRLQPSGDEVLAREAQLGSGTQVGFYWPILVGDEVLVFFPDGDRNAGVAISGLQSNVKASPSGDNNSQPGLTHPLGFEVIGPGVQAVEGVVKSGIIGDMQTHDQALQTFMTTISTATLAPQIAAAALVYLTTVALGGFAAKLSTSVAAGPPYRSTTLTTE